MNKLKLEDKVKILSGKDKGKTGKIEKVFPKKGLALVPGVNIYKKHIKAQAARDQKGGIYEIPRPLVFGKLALICPKCKKATRVGFGMEKGKKVRICKKCKKTIDTQKARKKK